MVSASWTRAARIRTFRIFSQTVTNRIVYGLSFQSKVGTFAVMVRGTSSRGTKKCRKFTFLVGSVNQMTIISIAFARHYCAFDHYRNGYLDFINRMPIIQRGKMTIRFVYAIVLVSAVLAAGSQGALARSPSPIVESPVSNSSPSRDTSAWVGEAGKASYYGPAYDGRRSASGARFDQMALTAAHPWLPFGTKVRVTLAGSSRSVVVTITDRLYSSRRIVDLSLAAARALGMIRRGVAEVTLVPV
jgi:rare lipoprotein A